MSHAPTLAKLLVPALFLMNPLPLGCKNNEARRASPGEAGLPDRDPALAHRLVEEENAVVLDVRTPEEHAAGHIEGATLIPHDELESRLAEVDALTGGDKTRPIVVYCKAGGRAGKAKTILLENGYERVTNLGGYSDW